MTAPCIFSLLAISLFAAGDADALGFANGVKIDGPTDQSVVLWTRLTTNAEPGNPDEKWTFKMPFLTTSITPQAASAEHHTVDGLIVNTRVIPAP